MKKRVDVLIIGGGPAGAACATRLRQSGAEALVLDGQPFPRFKPCAGWITPEIFSDLDLAPDDYPYGLTSFRSFRLSIRGLGFRLPVRQYAIRRIEFDDWLLKRSGVQVETHMVRGITHANGEYVVDGLFAGRYLVGAGGTRCPVYRTFFQSQNPREERKLITAMEDEFIYPIVDPTCRLWFFENGLPGYAWYVPKSGGYVNVGIGGMTAAMKKSGIPLKQYWRHLKVKLERIGLVCCHLYKPVGHAYYLRGVDPEPQRERAFIIGDAAGLATHDMGEGIRPALMSGLLAAEAILRGGELNFGSIPRVSWRSLLRLTRTKKKT